MLDAIRDHNCVCGGRGVAGGGGEGGGGRGRGADLVILLVYYLICSEVSM